MVEYRRPEDQIRDLKQIDMNILNLQLDARGSVMYDYAVTWSAETTVPSLGNGSLVGKYRRVGDLVLVNIRLQMGTTTTKGSGAWNFTPPFAVETGVYWLGSAIGFSATLGSWYPGVSFIENAGASPQLIVASLSETDKTPPFTNVRCNATAPISWGTAAGGQGDWLLMSLWYSTTE